MTEEMKNTLSEILEKTVEPISGLSIANLAVVHGIKFNTLSEKFTVYLDKERMTLVTSMFFYILGGIQLENLLTEAIKKAYPQYNIRYFYMNGHRKTYTHLR